MAQPVTFTFANHGSADATINTTTLAFTNSIGPRTNTCTDNLVLAPGQHCTITDTLKNATPGPLTWSATANYTGGFANNPLNVTQNTSTNVGDTVVTGSVVTPLPTNTQLNTNYSFQFTFANSAASQTAANNIQVVTATPHVTGLSNNCPTALAPGASCTISGTFNTNYGGPFSVQAILSYNEGNSVTLTSTTQAATFLYNYSFLATYIAGSTVTSSITGTPNMTLFNAPATAQLGPTAANNAISFNGIDQYAQTSNTPTTQIGGPTTIDFWINWDSFAQSWSRVIDFSNGMANDNILIGHVGTTSTFGFEVYNGATVVDRIHINNFWNTGVWTHVIITIDGSGTINIYKDNQLINLSSPPFPMTVSFNDQGAAIVTKTRTLNYVGRSAWAVDGYLDASIADLRIMQGIHPPI